MQKWVLEVYTNCKDGIQPVLPSGMGTIRFNPGPEVIKHFSSSTQLSMKLFMLINLKLLTVANSFLLNLAEHENFSANKYENAN